MRFQLSILSLASFFALAAPSVHAVEITLPPETAVFKPSTLPGYDLVQRNCMLCHSVHYIQSQPPQSPRTYWEATLKKMRKPFGATFPESEIPAMVDYLVKNYGAERPAGSGSK
jgi:sulfite dehydrogenase